ncbi:hypothetical protein ACH4CE_18025 [Streptomyces gelaticus]|uniref:hypothetical protein n=1 Tax=Streptomyces gelaticus TaxID=285446 RepID=UPI0037B01D42
MELTEAEQNALLAVAEQLTPKGFADGRIDDLRWLDAARDASVQLPHRMLVALRAFRHDAGPDGVLLLRNLPVVADDPLLPTPAELPCSIQGCTGAALPYTPEGLAWCGGPTGGR